MEQRRGHAVLIVNPAAGGGTRAIADEAEERCRAWRSAHVVCSAAPGGAVQLAADAARGGASVVIAVGGDGTVCEVAEGLARGLGRWPNGATGARGDGATLFVVPAGSGNSIYRALWGELPWREALPVALDDSKGCRVREIDLIRIADSDTAALLGVNAGLIARIAEIIEQMKTEARVAAGAEAPVTAEEHDAEVGQQRYWNAIGQALEELRAFPGRVMVDRRPVHEGDMSMVTVGGVRRWGRGTFDVLPRSVLDDGLLDVCVVAGLTSEQLAELAVAVPAGEHVGRPEVAYVQGRHVTIERTDGERFGIEHDGDPRPAGKMLELEIVPGAVPAFAGGAGDWG